MDTWMAPKYRPLFWLLLTDLNGLFLASSVSDGRWGWAMLNAFGALGCAAGVRAALDDL